MLVWKRAQINLIPFKKIDRYVQTNQPSTERVKSHFLRDGLFLRQNYTSWKISDTGPVVINN